MSRKLLMIPLLVSALLCSACQSTTKVSHKPAGSSAAKRTTSAAKPNRKSPLFGRDRQPVQKVVCLYDHKPWFSNDASGDRDPEGVRFRAFLVDSDDRSVLRDGTFSVDIYRIEYGADGIGQRKLIGDYRYPSDQFGRVGGGLTGDGYLVQLNWSDKDTPGHEIEIVTTFQDEAGRIARSETKRLKVPKFAS